MGPTERARQVDSVPDPTFNHDGNVEQD